VWRVRRPPRNNGSGPKRPAGNGASHNGVWVPTSG
jgi:hypothetical protein